MLLCRERQFRGEGRTEGESEETIQYKCNCFSPPLPSPLSLVSDPVVTVNLYGPRGQRAPLTHYTLPEGSYTIYIETEEERSMARWRTESAEAGGSGRR